MLRHQHKRFAVFIFENNSPGGFLKFNHSDAGIPKRVGLFASQNEPPLKWRARGDSNSRLSVPETDGLSTDLRAPDALSPDDIVAQDFRTIALSKILTAELLGQVCNLFPKTLY